MIVVVMGVTGSGKTSIGILLSQKLGWKFVDADSFHSAANVEKISKGIALDDADRAPWLRAIRDAMNGWVAEHKKVVLACSALKKSYRDELCIAGETRFVYLKGNYDLIAGRLRHRRGHFASETILASQFAALEEPGDAITVEIDHPEDEIVAEIIRRLGVPEWFLQARRKSNAFPMDSVTGIDLGVHVVAKLTRRLLPFLFVLYIVAYLDRINVGFAALQMRGQLGFSDEVYGLGAGIFFAGYFFFQVPSNLALARFGARRWIAVIMVVWGIISASMIFVGSPRGFYLLRFLLGAAEAGFFPGMILYLRQWFPSAARARAVALFMTAAPLAGVIGGPISGLLLGMHQGHLMGWQWLFLIEGLPAVLLGGVTLAYLTDRPEIATWLTDDERAWLMEQLANEEKPNPRASGGVFSALAQLRVWMLVVVYLGVTTAAYGIGLWLPSLLRNVSGTSNLVVGLLSAIPYLATVVAMVLVGISSDRTHDRKWHLAGSAFACSIALGCAAYSTSTTAVVVFLSVTLMGAFSMNGPFWAITTEMLTETSAAAGIAVINSLANLGGFLGPYTIGIIRTWTGSFRGGLLAVGALLAVSGALALLVDNKNADIKSHQAHTPEP